MLPPVPIPTPACADSSASSSPLRRAHFPAIGPNLAGIRAHPSLSAAQIGRIGRGSWVHFTEVLRNSDGIWLRLSEASRKEFLNGTTGSGQQTPPPPSSMEVGGTKY